jgi:hypothetical protein
MNHTNDERKDVYIIRYSLYSLEDKSDLEQKMYSSWQIIRIRDPDAFE